jgi:hypothetical protein
MQENFWPAVEAISTAGAAVLTLVALGVTVWTLRRTIKDQTEAVRKQTEAVRKQTEAVQAEAIRSASREVLELGKWLADRPWFRYALLCPVTKDSDYGEAAATVYADFMDHLLSQKFVYPEDLMPAWTKYFEGRLDMYPQIRKFVASNSEWYGPTLNGLVEQATDRAARA